MRRKRNPQTTIFEVLGKHPGPRELEQMAAILATSHDMLDRAYVDLLKQRRHDTGRDARARLGDQLMGVTIANLDATDASSKHTTNIVSSSALLSLLVDCSAPLLPTLSEHLTSSFDWDVNSLFY